MTEYNVIITREAADDLERVLIYLVEVKKNIQAAENVMEDYIITRKTLSSVAGSIKKPSNNRLNELGLKRINFHKHNYFMLFKISENTVYITNIFNFLEDYENKII